MKRGLISTPPSDMLPTSEGGKSNAWLRQKNAGIYVRPRLFSPYVEEAKVISATLDCSQIGVTRGFCKQGKILGCFVSLYMYWPKILTFSV